MGFLQRCHFRSLSAMIGISSSKETPLETLFPELASVLASESATPQEIERIAGGDGDMILSLHKHKLVSIPPYTLYAIVFAFPLASFWFMAESCIPKVKLVFS